MKKRPCITSLGKLSVDTGDDERAEIVRRVSRRQFGPGISDVAAEIVQATAAVRTWVWATIYLRA